jgi:hypothetical protein
MATRASATAVMKATASSGHASAAMRWGHVRPKCSEFLFRTRLALAALLLRLTSALRAHAAACSRFPMRPAIRVSFARALRAFRGVLLEGFKVGEYRAAPGANRLADLEAAETARLDQVLRGAFLDAEKVGDRRYSVEQVRWWALRVSGYWSVSFFPQLFPQGRDAAPCETAENCGVFGRGGRSSQGKKMLPSRVASASEYWRFRILRRRCSSFARAVVKPRIPNGFG